jgi:polysaccharide biosynthesis transport protein
MNSGGHTEPQREAAPHPGAGFDDALYTMFRHKWLILCFVVLGLIAAGVMRLLKPPLYKSEAKISVNFVLQSTGVTPANPETQMAAPGIGAQAIMDAEVELIKSLNTATVAATNFGAAKILAKRGGGDNPLAAAGEICSGLTVDPPRSATIVVVFKHPDETVVQPVLEELIKAYKQRHDAMRSFRDMEEVFAKDKEQSVEKLTQIDDELRELKREAGVLNPEETRKVYQDRIAKLQDELFEAESRLAQRQALYGEWISNPANAGETAVPVDRADDYREIVTQLDEVKKRVRRLLNEYTAAHPDVLKGKARVAELTRMKTELETAYPSLQALGAVGPLNLGTNNAAADISMALAEMKTLRRTTDSISNQLARVKTEAFQLMDFAKKFNDLERSRTMEQRNLDSILAKLENARMADSNSAGGRVTGMYLTQSPTPPGLDMKKQLKLIGMAFGGCVGLGLALAFLIDMVLDRTIRRRADVTRHLHLPVLLTIPDTAWKNGIHFPWLAANGHSKPQPKLAPSEAAEAASTMAVAEWNPTNYLQYHVEGLRERLITHFEVNNLNHKPKLVAITACDEGAGVTTLAAGLAAALSKTGDGSALLVDMNTADGKTQSFYRGKPGCGPSESTEIESAVEGETAATMAVAAISPEIRKHDRLAKLLPPSFNHLVPKLKATEYDYIVFDMPCVTQTSVTPRLASHMDIVLMVLESERTGQLPASRATTLMREARANVVAVLNKCRTYVPARLAHE